MVLWSIPAKIAFKWITFKAFIDIPEKHLVEQRSKKFRTKVKLNSFCSRLSDHIWEFMQGENWNFPIKHSKRTAICS